MKAYFFNKSEKRKSHNYDFIREAINGRYGVYCKSSYGNNYSQKAMEKDGYELVYLSDHEANKLYGLQLKRRMRLENQWKKEKLEARAQQVKICLSGEPLKLELNQGENPFVSQVISLAGTHMIDAYQGCGKGTAYINNNNELTAFHYGYEQPVNAPNTKSITVEFSCTQICING